MSREILLRLTEAQARQLIAQLGQLHVSSVTNPLVWNIYQTVSAVLDHADLTTADLTGLDVPETVDVIVSGRNKVDFTRGLVKQVLLNHPSAAMTRDELYAGVLALWNPTTFLAFSPRDFQQALVELEAEKLIIFKLEQNRFCLLR